VRFGVRFAGGFVPALAEDAPSRTTTQPTRGFGVVVYIPLAASFERAPHHGAIEFGETPFAALAGTGLDFLNGVAEIVGRLDWRYTDAKRM